jgi:alanyl-tRNA synthetase
MGDLSSTIDRDSVWRHTCDKGAEAVQYNDCFTATVTDCRPDRDQYAVILDLTEFHDGSGGQPPDRGMIDGLEVLHVYADQRQTLHVLSEPIETGRKVECVIDIKRRFMFMQHHTAEHILSGIVAARYGFTNVGFHIGAGDSLYATLDFDGEWPPADTPVLEYLANEAVWKNVPVTERPALSSDTYRSKKELEGDVRLVTVEGYDACACCGSHVRSTGEIGAIKIADAKRYKGGLRVTIVCGMRAAEDYAAKQEIIRRVCADLSVAEESLAESVRALSARLERQNAELAGLRVKLFERHIQDIERREPLTWVRWDYAERTDLPRMAAMLDGMVLLPKEDGGYYAALASKGGLAKELAAAVTGTCGGKGGGGPTLWQGSIERLPEVGT